MSAEEERKLYQGKLNDLHVAILGNDTLGVEGIVQKQENMNQQLGTIEIKLDKDHALLLPNRVMFGFFDLVKKPLAWLLALVILAALYGVSIADFIITKILGVK